MSASKSRLSYPDCFEVFEKALNSATGVRIKRRDYNSAYHLRSRLQYARSLDRAENREIYEIGDPLYGKSPYDPILVQVKNEGGLWYVTLRKVDSISYEVEDLEGVEESESETQGQVT